MQCMHIVFQNDKWKPQRLCFSYSTGTEHSVELARPLWSCENQVRRQKTDKLRTQLRQAPNSQNVGGCGERRAARRDKARWRPGGGSGAAERSFTRCWGSGRRALWVEKTLVAALSCSRGAFIGMYLCTLSFSPFLFAMKYDQYRVAELLVDRGADVDKSCGDEGDTPLFVAAQVSWFRRSKSCSLSNDYFIFVRFCVKKKKKQ